MSRSYWRGSRRSGRELLCVMLILGPVTLAACGSIPAAGSSAAASSPLRSSASASSASSASASSASASSASANAAGQAAAGKAAPASLALCANPAAASQVVIFRPATARQIQPGHVLPPALAVVTAAASVRALAKALCALPRMGKGVVECPALFEGSLTLRFTAAGRRLPAVTIQESGCEIVTGLGPARSVSKSPAFWTVLAKAVGTSSRARQLLLPLDPTGSSCQPISGRTFGNTHCPGRGGPGRSSHA
jgi:hypothetical protein